MTLLPQGFSFLFFIVLVFILPGNFLIRKIKKFQKIQNLSLSLVAGIAIYTVLTILLKYIGVGFRQIFLIYLIFDLIILINSRFYLPLKKIFDSEIILFFSAAVFIAFLEGSMLFSSGIRSSQGLNFYAGGTHDAMHHFSLIEEFRNHFPWQNPSFSREPLRNYHYFADLLMASFLEILPLNIFDFYFRIFPFFISLLFSLTIYALSSELSEKVWVRILSVILVTLGGAASFLLPIFGNRTPWSYGTFMVDQPFSKIFDPQTYIGYSFFLTGAFCIFVGERSKNWFLLILGAIFLPLAFGFKVYAAGVSLAALFCAAFYKLIISREIKWLGITAVGVLVFLLLAFTIISSYKNGLYLAPGWSLDVMTQSTERVNLVNWALKLQYYKATGNILRVAQIYVTESLIFIFGNLGVRTIGLFYLIYLFLKKLRSQKAGFAFLLSAVFISLGIPLLFNQGGSPFDIFQFAHYALIVTSIFTVVALEKVLFKFQLKKPLFLTSIFLVITFSIPTTLKSLKENLSSERILIDNNKMETVNFIRKRTSKDSVFLVYPVNDLSRYITGLGGRRVYISDLGTINYAAGDAKKRQQDVVDFFKKYDGDERNKFIEKNKINYIIFENKLSIIELRLFEFETGMVEVFSNSKYLVYKNPN